MKEFKFKKIKKDIVENNFQIIKAELTEFEYSLKNLSEKEISNLKSEFEKKISNSDIWIDILVIIIFISLCYLAAKYLFNLSIFSRVDWKTEIILLFIFSIQLNVANKSKDSNKKKLELINKF